MKKNDVIVSFAGKEIPDAGILRNAVAASPIGEAVKVAVLREGKREELTITIGSLESATAILAKTVKERLGVEVREVTARDAKKYNMDNKQGVVITWVDSKGPLGEAGFEVGDVILGVENQPIEGVENFISIASTLKPKQAVTLIALDHRSGNVGTIQITAKPERVKSGGSRQRPAEKLTWTLRKEERGLCGLESSTPALSFLL